MNQINQTRQRSVECKKRTLNQLEILNYPSPCDSMTNDFCSWVRITHIRDNDVQIWLHPERTPKSNHFSNISMLIRRFGRITRGILAELKNQITSHSARQQTSSTPAWAFSSFFDVLKHMRLRNHRQPWHTNFSSARELASGKPSSGARSCNLDGQ